MRIPCILVLVVACGGGSTSHSMDAAASSGDAGAEVHETCADPQPGSVDFLGEPCTEAPFPDVTECHAGVGWCVAGTCRPQCSSGCPRCTDGVTRMTDRGACYCSPQ